MSAAAVGTLAAGCLVLVRAVRARWLTLRAALAATAVAGAMWVGTGAGGVALLLFFFLSSVTAGRVRGERDGEGGEDGPRGAAQVLANGGIAAAAALLGAGRLLPPELVTAAAAGALAAATADTWSSEIGAAAGGRTLRLVARRRVEPGAVGGVSTAGLLAASGGAVATALLALALGLPPETVRGATNAGSGWAWTVAVASAGLAGALADSVTGELLEARGGMLGNDGVNLVATAVGALVAVALVSL